MWDLSKHEQLEMEALQGLNSVKLLERLIFCGGTMLRLCHGLNRYSVDLDFWMLDKKEEKILFSGIRDYLQKNYYLADAANKHHTLLFEFKSRNFPRRLKIEIRKEKEKVQYEGKIAFSEHSSIQVMLKCATLAEMTKAKIETLIDRHEIRDAFDIEFLLKKGMKLEATAKEKDQIKKIITGFKARDYGTTLGSLLAAKDRHYYRRTKFAYLLSCLE